MATIDPLQIEVWGEDGEMILAWGHVDLAAFWDTVKDMECLAAEQLDEDLLAGLPDECSHAWLKVVSWGEENPDDDDRYVAFVKEGDPGAQPATVLQQHWI